MAITFLGRKAFHPSRQDIETHRDKKLPDDVTDIAHDHHTHSIQVGTARWILLLVDDDGDRGVTTIEVDKASLTTAIYIHINLVANTEFILRSFLKLSDSR